MSWSKTKFQNFISFSVFLTLGILDWCEFQKYFCSHSISSIKVLRFYSTYFPSIDLVILNFLSIFGNIFLNQCIGKAYCLCTPKVHRIQLFLPADTKNLLTFHGCCLVFFVLFFLVFMQNTIQTRWSKVVSIVIIRSEYFRLLIYTGCKWYNHYSLQTSEMEWLRGKTEKKLNE